MNEHPIIACYRGLDSADAVQLGALVAGALGEPLVLACAYRYEPVGFSARALPAADNDRRAEGAERALARASAFAGRDTDVREVAIPAAGIATALTDLTRETDACMLILGRDVHGHVTRSLIPRSPCPVAVAPLSVALPAQATLRRVGVAFDASPTSRSALRAAVQLARAMSAELELLAVGAAADAALQIARRSIGDEIPCASRSLVGDPPAELATASRDLDLLVCGSRGRGAALATILGSVSRHLIGHAECPVLVVPPTVRRSVGPLDIGRAATSA